MGGVVVAEAVGGELVWRGVCGIATGFLTTALSFQAEEEERISDTLLCSMVPARIAHKLKVRAFARRYREDSLTELHHVSVPWTGAERHVLRRLGCCHRGTKTHL